MQKLNLSLADSEIQRWHPRFELDSVPDIESAALPLPPAVKGFSNAADVLEMSHGAIAGKVWTTFTVVPQTVLIG